MSFSPLSAAVEKDTIFGAAQRKLVPSYFSRALEYEIQPIQRSYLPIKTVKPPFSVLESFSCLL